jgi:hypothetical protein
MSVMISALWWSSPKTNWRGLDLLADRLVVSRGQCGVVIVYRSTTVFLRVETLPTNFPDASTSSAQTSPRPGVADRKGVIVARLWMTLYGNQSSLSRSRVAAGKRAFAGKA